MLFKANFFLNSYRNIRVLFLKNYSSLETVTSHESSAVLVEKPKREPFMKNVFVGVVDDIFFSYPEPLNKSPSNHFEQLLKTSQNSLSNKDLNDYEQFRSLLNCGILKYTLSDALGGIALNYTELLRCYEELNLNPSISALLESQSSLITPIILNHGSDDIHQKYLSKIISGELTGAYALTEHESGSDPTSIKTEVAEEEDCYRLNGEKIWVTNAERADFFLVFASNKLDNFDSMINELSVFLVEKSDQISLEKQELIGLNESGICKVKFKNTAVPKANVIGNIGKGYQIAGESIKYYKYITLIATLNNLKYFLSSALDYVHNRKQFPTDLKNCELVKHKLSTITSTIYTFESMIYLTCGMLDNYDIDSSIESAILQSYAFEQGQEALLLCMDLLGSRAYDVSFPYAKLWQNLRVLALSLKTKDIIKLYISLLGIDYAGNKLAESVRKSRNPFNFPGFVYKKMISNIKHQRGNPKLHLKLFMNLHPSLKGAANELEYCILRLQYITELLLIRHGSDLTGRQVELKMIADIATEIYAMVAVLSRASRAFCTGIKFCDQEIGFANSYCFHSSSKVKDRINFILDPERTVSDIKYFDLASHVLDNRSYFFDHPSNPSII